MRRDQKWPAQERLLSPLVAAFLFLVGAAGIIAIAERQPIAVCSVLTAALAIASWGEQAATESVVRFERRYARSPFVSCRLERRSRRRALFRTAQPVVRRVAHVTSWGAAILLALTIIAATSGVLPPVEHAPGWMYSLRLVVRAVSYFAAVTAWASFMLSQAIRGWNKDAASPPRDLPIVTSREFLRSVNRPGPRAGAAVAILIASLLLAVLS
jgi:hypothetical protein